MTNSDLPFKAISFANKVHTGQFRKSTNVPEVVHVIEVMALLLEYGFSEEVAIAGVLHDTLEDTSATYNDLVKKFGKKIADMVQGASEQDKSLAWEERKQKYIDNLATAPKEVLYIICADKISNLEFTIRELGRVGEKAWDRFNRGKDKNEWYYTTVGEVLNKRISDKDGSIMVQRLNASIKQVFNGT